MSALRRLTDYVPMQLTMQSSRTVRKALRTAFDWTPSSRSRQEVAASFGESVVVGGTMLGRTVTALEREFTARDLSRPCHREVVYHVSLAPSDGEVPTDADWAALGLLYAERLGFGNAAYVLVRRPTAEGDRLHFIAARVDAWDRPLSMPGPDKAERVLRELESAAGALVPQ